MPTTTTNFGWTVPADTDLVKDGAAAIRTALGGVDTSMVDLKGGTTGQVLSKATGTDMDFSWITSPGIAATIVDAKGDLIAATGADAVSRLAVGTNGQVLIADSTAATGLKWGAAGKVLQVVQGTTSTSMATTSTTYVDSNLTATITPSATSSKILVMFSDPIKATRTNDSNVFYWKIDRGGTNILPTGDVFVGASDGAYVTNALVSFNFTGSVLDSPATVSATTYKLQVKTIATNQTVTAQSDNRLATIILMEIGA